MSEELTSEDLAAMRERAEKMEQHPVARYFGVASDMNRLLAVYEKQQTELQQLRAQVDGRRVPVCNPPPYDQYVLVWWQNVPGFGELPDIAARRKAQEWDQAGQDYWDGTTKMWQGEEAPTHWAPLPSASSELETPEIEP